MAVIIKADGTEVRVRPQNGKDFSLEEMQSIVGGYIEVIQSNVRREVIVCNENGKLIGLPENKFASFYAHVMGFQICVDDYLCGDVLLCKSSEIK